MNAMKTRAKLHTTTIAMLALLLGFFLAVPNASAQINEEPPAPPEQAVDPEVAPEAAGAPADAPPQEVSGAANLVTVLEADGDYTIFVDALRRSGLDQTLAEKGSFTILAPTDEAFSKLEGGIDAMDDEELSALLRRHILPTAVTLDEAVASGSVVSASDATLTIVREGEQTWVQDATVVEADLQAGNGVIHGIDTVIAPAE